MRVRVFATPRAVARALAADTVAALVNNPRLVLGLPTGRTPIPFYRELAALHVQGVADFSKATTFNLDEFLGLSATDAGSYRRFMQRVLFDRVNLSPRRIHFLDGRAHDLTAECARYERAIRRAGGIDLLVLGLGANGHIGFNEPSPSLAAWTHRTRLEPSTRRANAGLFGHRISRVPHEALSMGIATILRARRIALVATGAAKAASVARVVRGPLTTRVPASFLQLHQRVDVWLDRAAASRLSL